MRRDDETGRGRWRRALFPTLAGMLLAFVATTFVLRAADEDEAAPARVTTAQEAPGPTDFATVERLVQDELQLRLEDPDVPGLPLTVTGVSCTTPVGGKARCAARFVDQGGRPPVRVVVSFPRGRMVWRVVR